jgi:hypothetical protein
MRQSIFFIILLSLKELGVFLPTIACEELESCCINDPQAGILSSGGYIETEAQVLVLGGAYNEEGKRPVPGSYEKGTHFLVDIDKSLEADFHADCWNPQTYRAFKDGQFNKVYFAHVGFGLPIDWLAYSKDIMEGKEPRIILRSHNLETVGAINIKLIEPLARAIFQSKRASSRNEILRTPLEKFETAPDSTVILFEIYRILQEGGTFEYRSIVLPRSVLLKCAQEWGNISKPSSADPPDNKLFLSYCVGGVFAFDPYFYTIPLTGSQKDKVYRDKYRYEENEKDGLFVEPVKNFEELKLIYNTLMQKAGFTRVTINQEQEENYGTDSISLKIKSVKISY